MSLPQGIRPGAQQVVIGVGLRPGAGIAALRQTVGLCLARVPDAEVVAVATLDSRAGHPALVGLAAEFGAEITGLTAARLRAQPVADPSGPVADAVGTPSVAEAAVLAVGGDLLVPKTRGDGVTVAIGRLPTPAATPYSRSAFIEAQTEVLSPPEEP